MITISNNGLVDNPVFFVSPPGLSFYTTEQGLSEAFSQCGQVVEGNNTFNIIITHWMNRLHSLPALCI